MAQAKDKDGMPTAFERKMSNRGLKAAPTKDLMQEHAGISPPTDVSAGAVDPRRPTKLAQAAQIEALIEKHTKDLPERPSNAAPPTPSSVTVALTGSTGSLGTALLPKLLDHPSIARIYCLNRSPSAPQKHLHGIPARYHSKLQFLTTSLSSPNLGLSAADYSDLASNIDIILHNAWDRSPHTTLQQHEPSFQGVLNLTLLSLSSPNSCPRIVFVSSIASAYDWPLLHPRSPEVPEAPIEDPLVAFATGYAASKFVAERILTIASQRAAVPVTVVRVGFLSAPTEEKVGIEWTQQGYTLPVLQASKAVGLVPREYPAIDWVPVDKLLPVLVELSIPVEDQGRAGKDTLMFYNIVNPHPVPFSTLVGILKEERGLQLNEVAFTEWIEALKKARGEEEARGGRRTEAFNLVGFFGLLGDGSSGVGLCTQASRRDSAAFAAMEGIGVDYLRARLEDWEM